MAEIEVLRGTDEAAGLAEDRMVEMVNEIEDRFGNRIAKVKIEFAPLAAVDDEREAATANMRNEEGDL